MNQSKLVPSLKFLYLDRYYKVHFPPKYAFLNKNKYMSHTPHYLKVFPLKMCIIKFYFDRFGLFRNMPENEKDKS